jgi:hypothetical protein
MLAQVASLADDPDRTTNTAAGSVEINAADALAVQRHTMSIKRAVADGAAHRVQVIALPDDVWTKNAGTWRMLKTFTPGLTMLRDGSIVIAKKRQGPPAAPDELKPLPMTSAQGGSGHQAACSLPFRT